MHGGLICISVCLSLTKILISGSILCLVSKVAYSEFDMWPLGHKGQGHRVKVNGYKVKVKWDVKEQGHGVKVNSHKVKVK